MRRGSTVSGVTGRRYTAAGCGPRAPVVSPDPGRPSVEEHQRTRLRRQGPAEAHHWRSGLASSVKWNCTEAGEFDGARGVGAAVEGLGQEATRCGFLAPAVRGGGAPGCGT